jgi:subtilisin family serine protease
VGALSYERGENAIAPFSNYGKHQVDVFAPGMQIYSTTPDNDYGYAQGTSMASPVVAGVAAVIRGYFPGLKACEVRDVIMSSVTPIEGFVLRPGDYEEVPASEISVSGGYVDVYQAFKAAEQLQKKSNKSKSEDSAPADKSATKKDGRA